MKSSFAAVLFAVAGVSAHKNVTYTTEVLTAVTTYCPEPTLLTHAGTTYTVTQATTLTITDCPCTVTKPVTTTTSTTCCDTVPTPFPAPPAPVPTVPFSNGTTAAITSYLPPGTGVPTFTPPAPTTTSPPITAGASKTALSGGLAAALGLVAYLL